MELDTRLKLRVPLIWLRVVRKEASIRRIKKPAVATTMVVFEWLESAERPRFRRCDQFD